MRQFSIDELTREEQANIDSYLRRTIKPGPIDGLFWLAIPQDLLGAAQQGHDSCGPFYFAIELQEDAVRFEFLVRSQTNLHCSCIAYATPGQRDFLLQFAETLLSTECIKA
jgi:hypothetical protein